MEQLHGLKESEVTQAREKYGSNVIPDSEPTTFWKEFRETFQDPMIRILVAIALLMIVMFFFGYAQIYGNHRGNSGGCFCDGQNWCGQRF